MLARMMGANGLGLPERSVPEWGVQVGKRGGLEEGRGRGVPGREKGQSKGLKWK